MSNTIEIKKNTSKEKLYNKKGVRQYLPILREWNNSIYNYNKNMKILLIKDKYVYKVLNSYFNLKKIKILKKRKFSIIKVFISKQEIKHINNKIFITLCLYNKEKISLKKYIFKLYKKVYKKVYKKAYNKVLLTNNENLYISKFLSKFSKLLYRNNINTCLLLKYKKHYILRIRYLLKKYKKIFNIKKLLIKLKFIDYKYNINNFLGLKNILYKIYNKKIEFNIINLKYIYLDGNILTEAVGAKLKNRKANLLKNIIKSISSVKIPYVIINEYVNKAYHFDLNNILSIVNTNLLLKKDIGKIKDSIYTFLEKSSIVLYKLKYKTIKGIRIQGTGRLTRRLTALRSVSKFKQKGCLKNNYSSYYNLSTVMLLGYVKSNLQYIKKNYNNRNGSYGIKTHISSF